jgi:hypothetical protein
MLATRFELAAVVALLGALGFTPAPGQSDEPPMTYRDEAVRGVVKEVDGTSLVLSGGERVALTERTQYLRETGLDTEPVKRSAIGKGTDFAPTDSGSRDAAAQ